MTPLLSNMSPDDMRVTMAEIQFGVHYYYFVPPHSEVPYYRCDSDREMDRITLPDYLNSLDAVAPVEARLTDSQREHVIDILMGDAERPLWKQVADAAFAKALPRTKAILLATGKARLS